MTFLFIFIYFFVYKGNNYKLNLVNSDLLSKGPPQNIVLACTFSAAHRQYNDTLIMPLDLTLPCFVLAFEEKKLFIHFLSPTDIRQTRVVCFAWGFPFQLGRAGMKAK